MIAIDTNVLVRFLTGDDPAQFARAKKLFGSEPVFIPETVLLECEWVLRHAYGFPAAKIQNSLRGILGLESVKVARPLVVHDALGWFRDGMDFADALHLAGCGHCEKMATFDRAFIKSAKGSSFSCTVSLP